MQERDKIYDDLRIKMESAGFQFEREQQPHFQSRREKELKFIHQQLLKKFEHDGIKTNAKKFYIKPLSDEENCEIGFATGKTSPLHKRLGFVTPNTIDSFDQSPAWTNRANDHSLDLLLNSIKNYLSEPVSSVLENSNTFLFAWNPNEWDWVDLQPSIDQLNNVGYVEIRWSCGNSKRIKKGDRIFLIRLGKEPKGIIGSGYAKSSYFVAPHWDGTHDKTTNYIDIEFDILINPETNKPFDTNYLKKVDPGNIQQWFPQQSGISIKSDIIDELESSWFTFITENKYIGNSFISNDIAIETSETFREGKSKDIIQTRYERNPQARKTCLKHYGYSCKICDFSFESFFGEVGIGFIHIHHINPIADIGKEYEIDPKTDLIPVCPNCHAMIHARRPPFSIDEIMEIRKMNYNSGLA